MREFTVIFNSSRLRVSAVLIFKPDLFSKVDIPGMRIKLLRFLHMLNNSYFISFSSIDD
jgi:hypothetical protein